MSKNLILIGGGGHAKACIDVIEQEGSYTIKGIIDLPEKVGTETLGYKVIGIEDDIAGLVKDDHYFLIAVGQIKSARIRVRIWDLLKSLNAQVATVISPFAYVSGHATVNEGTVIMHGARINADVVIGCNTIINTNAIVEHDTIVGEHCHISTGAVLNGGCCTGNEVFVGSGAVINQGINIASNVKIGAASLIHRNIKEEGTYIGVPFVKIL
ncbi:MULTISPECIES: acetyltransferase [unclassified Chitinophaga]|uniref:acetyltransferase n=1 Tax=unclassified Chitinophaga TaxID=2619133 RepID=UPI00301019C9